jgi:hypothetical protein
MERKITRRNVIDLWASQYPEVTRWLTKLQQKEQSALSFYRFCEWAHKTPPELLALKEKDASVSPAPNIVEKLLDDFCGQESADFTNSEKYLSAIAVKSFFKWNYRDLAKASGIVSLEKVKPYNALSKEGLRKLWSLALNPRDRALIPFVTSTGIAKETLCNLTWGHLEEGWEAKELPCIQIAPELLKGHGVGKYKGVRQVTFLTSEAKRELIVYKGWMEEKLGRKFTPQDHIWLTTCKPYEPLSYAMLGNQIMILSDKAKVPFSLHDGRRWVNTALEQIGISSNWARKIRGRKVKGEEAPYSQPAIEQLREKFREAVPILEFISERPAMPKEAMERISALEEEIKAEKRRYGLARKVRHIKPPEEEAEEPEKCENGEHCQKVVSEEELPKFLSEGWTATLVLPTGKIVVAKV